MQIMLRKDGQETGPFTLDQISAMLNEGQITRTDFAFHEGLSNWLPVAAVLAPRSTPPPSQENEPAFESSRVKPNKTFSQIISQASELDWNNVLPFQAILKEKPWNLLWVRWVFWFAMSTFLIQCFRQSDDLNNDDAILLIALNWMLAWSFAFFFIIKPATIQIRRVLTLILPSVALMVSLLVLAGKFNFLNAIFQSTSDASLFQRIWSIPVTSLFQVVIMAAPFIIIYCRKKESDSAPNIIYYGLVAGLASGLVPSLTGVLEQKWPSWSGVSVGIYQPQSLFFILSFPLLIGLWGGVMGNFIVCAIKNRGRAYGWLVAAILVPMVLMAVFLAASSLIIRLVIIFISICALSAYLKQQRES